MWWVKRNKYKEQGMWHIWFAWYPVKLRNYFPDGDSKTYWLEYVERQKCYDYVCQEGCWHYRDLMSVKGEMV